MDINKRHYHPFLLVLMALLLSGLACRGESTLGEQDVSSSEPTELNPVPTETVVPEVVRQWAVSAFDEWGYGQADNALGEPVGDENCLLFPQEAWTYHSDPHYDHDFLQLFYEQPVIPMMLEIHLAYTHSAITRVMVIDVEGMPHEVYNDEPQDLESCPTSFSIELDGFTLPVYAIRIDVNTLWDNSGITAIDAVELVGMAPPGFVPTPEPTPFVTVSSLGRSINDLPEGFAHMTILDNNYNRVLVESECDGFAWNLDEYAYTIRFFSCIDQSEAWLYLPLDLAIGPIPLNTYPTVPSGRLFYEGGYIPAMEGFGAIDRLSETHISGVIEFWGFDPINHVDYFKVVLVFNQVPLNEESGYEVGDMIQQWADAAAASSEMGQNGYSADQAVGPSDSWFDCEDAPTAWVPADPDGVAWLQLTFEQPVYPKTLNLLMTANPGAVTEVSLFSDTDFWPLDLDQATIIEGCPTALVFEGLDHVRMPIRGILVMVSFQRGEPRPGIDAVQLIGVLAE